MDRRIMHVLWGLTIALFAFSGLAQAVSLGKIDVASHLGEPFFAEVPLSLDDGEVISNVYVELADPADYRILEVYRDDALNQIRADVKSDSRGKRVELSSRDAIDAPFFNLVLKVRHERATHFKKYAIFLDLPRTIQPTEAKAVPVITPEEAAKTVVPMVTPVQPAAETEAAAEEAAPAFQPYEGWARTGRYGPMVFGDTITTVAHRLRIDDRYTNEQVMVALFEKNRSKFGEDNINLIKAGTYLDVPSATEVERIAPGQARQILGEHEKRWRQLTEQPRYAAVAEAQRTRYSKRIRVGEAASGSAVAPMPQLEQAGGAEAEQLLPEGGGVKAGAAAGGAMDAETASMLEMLRKQNEELQARLQESESKIAELTAAASSAPSETQAAMESKIKRLEMQLARMQSDLDEARQSTAVGAGTDMLTYGLMALVVVLLIAIGYLLHRQRQHPAMAMLAGEPAAMREPQVRGKVHEEAAMPEVEVEELPEVEVEPVEEEAPDATVQMTTQEFEESFTDSIPDLTDEDTSQMDAFKMEDEEEPDPNVDYLTEADVYMRYGMEDEAEKQVQLALRLRDDNKDAHAKLVQIRRARGDSEGADKAIEAARGILLGEALAGFEAAIAGETAVAGGEGEVSLADTMPPGSLEATEEFDTSGAVEDIDFASLEMGSLDMGEEGGEEAAEATAAGEVTAAEDAALDLGDLEWGSEETATEIAEEETVVEAPAEEPAGDLDFDLAGLPPLETKSAAMPAAEEEALETAEMGIETVGALAEPAKPAVGSEEVTVDLGEEEGEAGFDLADLEIPEEGVAEPVAEPKAMPELATADMDKTVVMDWSSSTLLSEEEEPAVETIEEEPGEPALEPEAEAEAEAPLEKPAAEGKAADVELDFDLDNMEVDLAESATEEDMDAFTDTIRSSLDRLAGGAPSDTETADESGEHEAVDLDVGIGDLDADFGEFGLEPLDEKAPEGGTAQGAGGDVESELEGLDFHLDEDIASESGQEFDATQELENLLSELGDLDNDSGKPDNDDADKPEQS